MGTEILKSFGTLQSELEQAKSSLKGVDENIKRLIGRDPSELPPRANLKRGPQNDDRNRQRVGRNRNFNHENDEPPSKRRTGVSVFKRLSERPVHYEEDLHQQPQKQMISKVIVTPKELPSRQEALAAQSKDEKSKERNRRMFGALLGTLQKFQQEETKLKQKEEKRAQLEKKIEEHEIKEKEEIKKERQELFYNRKKKQAEIKMIELKMMRMKEYAAWEERQKPRMNFIQTKAKPHIHYLPRKMNDASKALLDSCKADIEKMIDKKRQEVFDELQHIEERMKKNFELRKSKEAKEEPQDGHEKNEENGDLETSTEEKHESVEAEKAHESPTEEKAPVDQQQTNGTGEVEGKSDELSTQEENWDGEAIPENKEPEKDAAQEEQMHVDNEECL
ncbi:pinin [Tribolium castaneum]|uniref:Pinin n=1 Tax=Tribolium castaneum TaxID=7070 RepID=D6WR51_TRICA|nr:PREDICTED: pinin [Tribolium castaneum]EFA07683.2 Pinin-like Protein [Tribolium castaneum]|eukprot:XP_975481.1 PREDICTED: pinin [Tribolium castaneum]